MMRFNKGDPITYTWNIGINGHGQNGSKQFPVIANAKGTFLRYQGNLSARVLLKKDDIEREMTVYVSKLSPAGDA